MILIELRQAHIISYQCYRMLSLNSRRYFLVLLNVFIVLIQHNYNSVRKHSREQQQRYVDCCRYFVPGLPHCDPDRVEEGPYCVPG